LIRAVGLPPKVLLSKKAEVILTLQKASRKQLSLETIDDLLKRAKDSIGTRQGESVINEQFRLVVDYLDFVETQVQAINKELRNRMETLNSPLMSLGMCQCEVPHVAASWETCKRTVTLFANLDIFQWRF